jgi:predicted NACHT family NTPase
MLDGFDELSEKQRHKISPWIKRQILHYGNSIFIVTSRPKAYKNQDAASRLDFPTTLWINGFNKAQRESFLKNWYRYQKRSIAEIKKEDIESLTLSITLKELTKYIEERKEFKDFSKNPLLLNMILNLFHLDPKNYTPPKLAELCREVCRLKITDRPKARQLDTSLEKLEALDFLRLLASKTNTQRGQKLSRSDFLALATKYLSEQAFSDDESKVLAEGILEDLIQVSEILVEFEDGEVIGFASNCLCDYLAGVEAALSEAEPV